MQKKNKISITPEIRATLLAHKERTKIAPVKLLNYKEKHPDGLTYSMVICWLKGISKSALPEHLDYVLKKWEALPSIDFEYIKIKTDALKKMRRYWDQTGISPEELLRQYHDIPIGLTAAIINNWFSGKVKTAREDHFNFIFDKWQELSTNIPKRIKLTDQILQELKEYRTKTDLLPGNILKDAIDKPDGLASYMISSWLAGHTKTARKDHIEYVLNRCRQFIKQQ